MTRRNTAPTTDPDTVPAPASGRRAPGGTHGPRLRADERRAEVIEAAVLAFASGGYAGTSTEEIARLAGVSQPYLFRLFGSKRELFIAAVSRMFDRIRGTFEAAARQPVDVPEGYDPVLASIGHSYGALLADRSLLRMQLHAFAACDDPEIRAVVRRGFADLVDRVGQLADTPPEALRAFFAEGMLMNVAAAMDLADADVAWDRICDGGPA
jgi:AcrR family transcriptional regulator